MIFFPGDEVRATIDGNVITGVVENFTYDNEGWARGFPDDIANVRTDAGMVAVPVAELRAVAS